MDEQREKYSFDPESFVSASEQPQTASVCAAEEARGGTVSGIFGALLGALVGAVPWFLTSTFVRFFVGWLGFLVGIAACCGYRLFNGRRSTRFAMVTVIVSSILALFAAELASWMYVLCTDPEWQADAAWYGISVAELAWGSIMMPENWGVMAPNMLVGMAIGVLGALCVKRRVLAYTEPGRMTQTEQSAQTSAAGFAASESFTVQDKTWVRVTARLFGAVCASGFLVFFASVLGSSIDEPENWSMAETVGFSVFSLLMAVFGVFLIFHVRRKLVVENDVLSYLPTFGKARAFRLTDIAGMTVSANGRRLIGHDGRTLGRFEDNQENSALLLQYLNEHGIGLLVK